MRNEINQQIKEKWECEKYPPEKTRKEIKIDFNKTIEINLSVLICALILVFILGAYLF